MIKRDKRNRIEPQFGENWKNRKIVQRYSIQNSMTNKGTNCQKNPKRFCQNMNRFFDDY